MSALIRQYNELKHYLATDKQQAIRLPELSPCDVLVSAAAPAEQHEDVLEAIREFKPLQGWLCYQSDVVSLTDGDLSFLENEQLGWLLSGEFSNASRDSLHITQNGQGQWLVTTYQEQTGSALLKQTMSYLATKKALGHLAYAVYWRHDPVMGYQKVHSRFLGFSQEALS